MSSTMGRTLFAISINGETVSIARAVQCVQDALNLAPESDPNRFARLIFLGHFLSMQYEIQGKLDDLNQAIEYSQDAVNMTPEGSPDRATCLNNLSAYLRTRYGREGKLDDLNKAVEYSQDAVNLTPEGGPDRAGYLNGLSDHLSTRYGREGKLDDLNKAIEYSQDAVNLTPEETSDRAVRLNNLSNYLSMRYEREWKLDDLNQAIECSQDALNLTPEESPDRAGYLNGLSNHLSTRYEREGKLDDLNKAVEYSQDALNLTPEESPDRAGYLSNLSNRLSMRYKREGKLDDFNKAVEYSQDALNLKPEGSPDRAGYLNNLSIRLITRYEKEGKLDDLNKAVEYSQDALNLTPEETSDRAVRLNNLSSYLSTRYEREGKLNDLNQAIECSQDALNLTPEESPDRAEYLNGLSIHLSTRYEREGKLDDLNKAVEYSQDALNLTPEGSPDRARHLDTLSIHLNMRYEREGKLDDLNQAIEYSQDAVNLTPEGNPHRAGLLHNLSRYLSTRYEIQGKLDDLDRAIEYSRKAWESTNSPPSMRVLGCQEATDLLTRLEKWKEAKALLDEGFKIFPFLISHMTSKLDQENMIESISGMAATGCALSLHCNEDDFNTIKILELGRGTISRLTINSKSDLSELGQHHPNLAKRFEDLRSIINNPFHSTDAGQKTAPNPSSLSADLKDLLSEIRREEGFEYFQDLPSKDKLWETGKGETKVFLNTTHFRTDAIMINGNGCIRALPLDPSVFTAAQDYYGKLRSRFGYDGTSLESSLKTWTPANEDMSRFLRWLWDFMVKPVFDTLNLEPLTEIYEQEKSSHEDEIARFAHSSATRNSGALHADRLAILRKLMTRYPGPTSSVDIQPSSQNSSQVSADVSKLPRIHWIGVGLLGVFPFHAAGYGSQVPTSNTMSYAISSYAASLTTLSFAKCKPMTLAASRSKLLLVTMPYTPGQNPLDGVEKEADIIQDIVSGSIPVKLQNMPIVQSVLDDLPSYDIVHFACHGFADPKSPFRSGLLLSGDEPGTPFNENIRNSTLTVERISSMNLEDSQLAFLSACCTAQNAASALVDEGIHLASGFQLSGFPHVIASLWEADDALSVAMTERFYRSILGWNGANGHEKVACALHEAVLRARQICNDHPMRWATMIHFGP